MNIINALINAVAVWFVLKAVEVIPFAIYDLFVLIKECVTRREEDPIHLHHPKLKERFDRRRGELEFVFFGAGFFQLSLCKRSKRLFLIASLVPLLVFVLEILSIFLGDETRACQTSTDPNVVKAPSLQLFGEGKREIDAVGLNDEIVLGGRVLRPCFQRQSVYSGVEYIASVCATGLTIAAPHIIVKTLFPENERISITVPKSHTNGTEFLLNLFTRRFENSYNNATLVGSYQISSDVLVNGKSIIINDVIKDFVINETITEQIRNDVKALEEAYNSTRSEFREHPDFFVFEWADLGDLAFGAANVVYAIMSQCRSVGPRTAAEMSASNVALSHFSDFEILCQEDFFLPRIVSIVIILTAASLRLLLIAIPKSRSSAEYALLISEKGEGRHTSAETASV